MNILDDSIRRTERWAEREARVVEWNRPRRRVRRAIRNRIPTRVWLVYYALRGWPIVADVRIEGTIHLRPGPCLIVNVLVTGKDGPAVALHPDERPFGAIVNGRGEPPAPRIRAL